ncbi:MULTISPECIES: LuxR family transcriptional regulator [Vibrio harveyi group]|uniref:LuxR family transcriptional regulator n=1 Tax=Vibrio harveyi group TaxID=717610 RepID=UPI0015F3BD78|nr:LuxR family transcriptional regulator [Vibrio alginolyticus]EJE4208753.1 LuxR family transcriptional regulator [Vibrio parahaemolyticus]HDM8060864.1 LuxR family transcriptional regulator [Vibrio harveyi]
MINKELVGHLENILSSNTEEEWLNQLKKCARALEFDDVAYGYEHRLTINRDESRMFNTYPSKWNQTYIDNKYILLDPVVKIARTTNSPVNWRDCFHENPHFWEEANAFNVKYGWSQAIHSPNGTSSLLSLSRDTQDLVGYELLEKTPLLLWLANTADQSFRSLAMNPDNQKVKLTNREREVLLWSAEGKTVCEIAIILNVKEPTVNYHVYNAIAKLKVNNKTAAVVKAALLGLL